MNKILVALLLCFATTFTCFAGQQTVDQLTVSTKLTGPAAQSNEDYTTLQQVKEQFDEIHNELETFAVKTLYGTTNAHPDIAGASILSDNVPTTSILVTVPLAAGTNFIGTFLSTQKVSKVTKQSHILRWWTSKDNSRAVRAFCELITVDSVTGVTNVIQRSTIVSIPQEFIDSRVTITPTNAITCDNDCYIGVNYYLIRDAQAVSVTTYLGTPFNTHIEFNGFDSISGLLSDAPDTGGLFGRQSNEWVAISASGVNTNTSYTMDVNTTQTVDNMVLMSTNGILYLGGTNNARFTFNSSNEVCIEYWNTGSNDWIRAASFTRE